MSKADRESNPRRLVPGARADVDADLFDFRGVLGDDERALLDRLRGWLESNLAPIANQCWADGEFPHHLVAGFADLGVVGLPYDLPGTPAEGRLLSGFISLEISRIDSSFSSFYGVHSGLAMGSIHYCGSPEQKDRWLPAMRRMEQIGAFALTEPHGGSDVAGGLVTTARREGEEWVLDGAKRWIGNGTFADLVVVWARDVADDTVKGFVVSQDSPGFTATKMEGKLALRTVQNADLHLDGVRVAESDRLQNATSLADTNTVLRHTRGGVAWSSVGAMMAVYEVAVQYARDREQFGRPIGGFQLVQDLLARMIANITASLGLAVRVAQLQDEGIFRDDRARWRSRSAPVACGRRSRGPGSCWAGTGYCWSTASSATSTTLRRCTPSKARVRSTP